MLNHALELEHAARIQYLAHAELINGINAEKIIGRLQEILEVNLKGEKEAIDFYKQIYQKIRDNKKDLQYEFETLEHGIRHVIIDEQEHVVELSLLLFSVNKKIPKKVQER